MEGWSEFAVAAAGAAAALAGLVIVAISVNVREILAAPALVPRAALTIAGLIVALMAALAILVPQTLTAAGVELLLLTGAAGYIEGRALRAELRQVPKRPASEAVMHTALAASWLVPLLVAGVLLCAASPAGVYALAIGIGTAVIAAVANTWVLLIEVLR